jgi:hypothetical protein
MPINVTLNPLAQTIYDSHKWLQELDIKLITDKHGLNILFTILKQQA